MINENARKWVEALRSGKYKQGQKVLFCDGKYCCLGVACAIAQEHGIDAPLSGTHLKPACMNWLGLRYCNGGFHDNNLVDWNDRGRTFLEIADLIESEPAGLFI